jgi:hypothetical protein
MVVPKTAGRTPIACTNCAKTKTKCDKKFPCSRCTSRNLKCVLRPTRRVPRNNIGRLPISVEGDNGPTTSVGTLVKSENHSPPPHDIAKSPLEHSLTFVNQAHVHGSNKSAKSPESQQIVSTEPSTAFLGEVSPGTQTTCPTISSPVLSPGSIATGLVSDTSMSRYEEFEGFSQLEDEQSSRFLADWSTIQFSPASSDSMARYNLFVNPEIAGLIPYDVLAESNMLSMAPEYSIQLGPLDTPIATPRLSMSTSQSEFELCSSSSVFGDHTRHTSYSDSSCSKDIPSVVKAQDGWNCFRSGPILSSDRCPKTGKAHLEQLEKSLKDHERWSSWEPTLQDINPTHDHLEIVTLDDCSRDRLMAITQNFLHKALETHQNSPFSSPLEPFTLLPMSSNFILLPKAPVLNFFLQAYVDTFERFFPMTSKGSLNLNYLLMNNQGSDRSSSLLTLLMIAAGALYIPSMEARWLNGGLVETCRISLFDTVDTNISMASDHTLLHSALLFVAIAAWSGDKWHMNIAIGQKGMYTAMLRHSGALETRPTQMNFCHDSPQDAWAEWVRYESRSR